MAFSRVAVHFFCFLLLLALAQARESQFFSKAPRYTVPDEATPGKEEESTTPVAKKDEEVQYKSDINGGGSYGLYGHAAPERNIPAATSTSAGDAFPSTSGGYNTGAGHKFSTESFPGELNKEGTQFEGAAVSSYGKTNKEFDAAAGHPDVKQYYYNGGNTPTYNAGSTNVNNAAAESYELNDDNDDGHKYYYSSKEASTRHPTSYANRGEQYYGMSDTRFLDNGRYFYDLKAENSYRNGGRYDPAGAHPGGYGGGQRSFANGGGGAAYTFGNNNNEESGGYAEENNYSSMRGYRSNQREEYVP